MKAAPRPRRIEGSQAAERGRYSTATTHSAATKSRLAAFTADYTATAESTTTRQTATRLRRATNMVGADHGTAALQTLRGRPPGERRHAATEPDGAQNVPQNKTKTATKNNQNDRRTNNNNNVLFANKTTTNNLHNNFTRNNTEIP